MEKLLFKEETYQIRGAIYEVNRVMGCGFLEAVYQECLQIEFVSREIPHIVKPELLICYKEKPLIQKYAPDFICYDSIILELKAVTDINEMHRAQVFNYIKATKMKLGLLVNFGAHPKATVERIVL